MPNENKEEVRVEQNVIKCSKEFKEMVEDLIDRWYEKNGFKISYADATGIILKKINSVGGIRI